MRRPGGGRKRLAETDPGLAGALETLIKDAMRGDPQSPLVWTTRSAEHLAGQLTAQGHPCSDSTVLRMLQRAGFTQQSNSRAQEGRRHPERDEQFRYIAAQVKEHQDGGAAGDERGRQEEEEKIGNFGQDGREWRPQGEPAAVRSHDFPDKDGKHAIPYGIWDEQASSGFVNVGTDGNTAALAVESIRRWWALAGKDAYPGAARLLVTCDAGGSNGCRNGHWKAGLAQLAQETGLQITVCHFPPGTSKWNQIEHRLFCQITLAWRGRPLTSYDVIINTIGAVRTRTGLTATAVLDQNEYPTGTQISAGQIKDIEDRWLTRHAFHGEWNYALLPVPRPAPAPGPAPGRPPRTYTPPWPIPRSPACRARTSPPSPPAWKSRWPPPASSASTPGRASPARIDNHRVPRTRLTPQARVLAAVFRYRLGMTGRAIAALFGIDTSVISTATRQIAALTGTATGPLAPGPVRLRTLNDLHGHAARHHITINGPAQAADTPPDDTVTTPAMP